MKWIIRGYAMVLLAYTGWRTYDFMVAQLPAGDLSTWLAIFFLFSTEAGLALWHEISLHHINTSEQRHISVALTWIDFAGSLCAGIADMILRQSFYQGYVIPPALALFLLYGLPGIVAVNIAGVLYYFTNDADVQLDHKKKELKFAITRQALRELDENKDAIAESMKKDIFEKLRDDVTGKVARRFLRNTPGSQTGLPPALPDDRQARVISPDNGKTAIKFIAETEKPGNPTRPPRQDHS